MKTYNPVVFLAIVGAFFFPSSQIIRAVHGEAKQNIDSSWKKELPESIRELEEIQDHLQSQFLMVKNSVVSVETEDGAGSGVLVSPDGLVLTAAHVIGESGKEMKLIFPDGQKVQAISLGGSELSDAGLLKIIEKGNWAHATMAPSNTSKIGDWCFALGHPSGFDLERGMVLRVGRIIQKKEETLQTDCRLLGGDSGGPLFSMNGEVIGIHSRISGSPEDNFHTPIESFLSNWEYFLNEKLHTLGSMNHGGFLGILCEQKSGGLTVVEVVQNTPAIRAGIQVGDILKRIDGTPLDTREKLTILVSSKIPGTLIVIDYLRNGKEISSRIQLGDRHSLE